MAIKNYTTTIDFERTIGEITKCLREHRAEKIITDYQDQIPVGITFCIRINEQLIGFNLPANYGGVLRAMQENRKVSRALCTKEQALRVSWRIVKDWIQAQMAIVEAELVKIEEVFLPYMITKSGNTVFTEFQNNNFKQLN